MSFLTFVGLKCGINNNITDHLQTDAVKVQPYTGLQIVSSPSYISFDDKWLTSTTELANNVRESTHILRSSPISIEFNSN